MAGTPDDMSPSRQYGQRDRRNRPTGFGRDLSGLMALYENKQAVKSRPWAAFNGSGKAQAEKLDPHPQVLVAFGFLITN